MFKKEAKVAEKWVIDKFKEFSDEEAGMLLLMKVLAKEMEWLRKQEARFWEEVEKMHGLDPDYIHNYYPKTKTIKRLYRMVVAKTD